MRLERESLRSLYRGPELIIGAGADGISRAEYHVTRKRIALKHPVERLIDLFFGKLPCHQRALGQVSGEQSLADTPDCSRTQHGSNARHHILDTHARAARNLLERFANKSFDLVFRNGENFRVD